jgi:hypothetical protein
MRGSASLVGSSSYNQDLSERRVRRVATFLLMAGIAPAQMQLKATGNAMAIGHRLDDAHDRAVALVVIQRPPSPGVPPPAPPIPPAATALRTVKIWLNSFIPRDVLGVTHPLTVGPRAPTTYVIGPPVPAFGIPPFKRGAFLTSNRFFDSSDTRAPTHFKMHSDITVDFLPGGKSILGKPVHVGGESSEIEPTTGVVLRTEFGSTLRMFIFQVPGLFVPGGAVRLSVRMASAIPLIFGASLVADMDIQGSITIFPASREVTFEGKVDSFPAYEAYVSGDGNPPVTLFNIPIAPGKTPNDLIGPPDVPVKNVITI